LGAIYYLDATWKLGKGNAVKKSWRAILTEKEKEIFTKDDGSTDLHRKILEDRQF